MKSHFARLIAGLLLGVFARAPSAAAQTPALQPQKGMMWTESFDGSTDSDGQVMMLTSAAGYNFSNTFGMVAGLPVYFIHASSATKGPGASSGIGNGFLALRYSKKESLLNYRSTLTGAAPTGDSKKGLSTGRVTFDWSNRFDREFDRWTPFADAGVGNSLPDMKYLIRQFTSLGMLAHFDAGTDFDVAGPFSVTVSLYDIAPWGTQKVFSRLVARSQTGPAGGGGHHRVYETSAETVGNASLTRDNGYSAGLDASVSRAVDLGLGFTHSMHFALNSVYFNVTFNMTELLKRGRAP